MSMMMVMVAVLLCTVVFFIHGKLRSDLIAIGALLILLLTGILTPAEAFTGFSNSIIFIIASMFIVSGAIVRSGLANMVSKFILSIAGNNFKLLFVLTMLLSGLIGTLVSNTGTVAIMMPIVVSLAISAKVSPSRMLMPLAFMSGIGGMFTLIGNPPNMVANDVYVKAGYESLKLFSFLPIGVICIVFGMVVLVPFTYVALSRRSDKKIEENKPDSLHSLVEKYNLSKNSFKAAIPGKSQIINQSLINLRLTTEYGVSVLDIKRRVKSHSFGAPDFEHVVPSPNTVLVSGDVLDIVGDRANVDNFIEVFKLHLLDGRDSMADDDRFTSIGLAELVLMSSSELVNSTVEGAKIRERFGVTVLSIQRGGQYIMDKLKDQVLQAGDAVLVQGSWKTISDLEAASGVRSWVVVGNRISHGGNFLVKKIPLVALILVGMIVAMATGVLPTVTVALIAAVLMIAIGCFRNMGDVYSFISWETIVMISCMLPFSIAMEKTGLVAFASEHMSVVGTMYGAHAALIAIYFMTSLLNTVISFTPLTLLVAPIAMGIAQDLGVNPLPFMMAVASAASLCFGSSFSTPSNALVVSPGRYTFMDYAKIGLPLQLLLGAILVFAIPMIFPF